MRNKTIFFLFFLLTAIIINLTSPCIYADVVDNFVITDIVTDDSGKLLLVGGKNSSNVADYKITKLDNPERLVVDIPNAVLSGKKQSFKVGNSGITDIKVAQFSVEPNIVRLVFTADTSDSIKKLTFRKAENTLVFRLNGVESQKNLSQTVYQDKETDNPDKSVTKETKNQEEKQLSQISEIDQEKPPVETKPDLIINTISSINGHLLLSGTGWVSIKEPFILSNPTRLVVDLHKSALVSPDLMKTYKVGNFDIARIAQFDPETLRLVIETSNPSSYKTIIAPDSQSLVIAPKNNIDLSIIPNGKIPSQIMDINVLKKGNRSTSVILTANYPIIHNIKHSYKPEKISLELYNVNAPVRELVLKLPRTEQFNGVNIDYIEKYPMGSKWIFPISSGTRVESKLSVDGKTLELSLLDKLPAPTGRVVIDAGHGGRDMGAFRGTVQEKTINLDIAKKVYKYLYMAGIDVIMTRHEDEYVSLKGRTDIANSVNPDLFVSIHVNACENSRINGIETYWYTPQSRELAKTVHSKLTSYVNAYNRGILKAMFYVIHHTKAPSILVEVGYISNEDERCQMLTEERKDIYARAIADGIIQYLRSGR